LVAITVAREAGKNNGIRADLGNDIVVKAFRDGTLPFPDGDCASGICL